MAGNQQDLERLVEHIANVEHRPVHEWNPERIGSIDIDIHRDGSWSHQGSLIKRQSLVRLFASVLRKDGDDYFLVTPVEKLKINVEIAPFVVTALQVFHSGSKEQVISGNTNLDEQFVIDESHPLRVNTTAEGDPLPYVELRDGLTGLLNRSVWMELSDFVVEENSILGVLSSGTFFELQ